VAAVNAEVGSGARAEMLTMRSDLSRSPSLPGAALQAPRSGERRNSTADGVRRTLPRALHDRTPLVTAGGAHSNAAAALEWRLYRRVAEL
jgi:hypothetical protein